MAPPPPHPWGGGGDGGGGGGGLRGGGWGVYLFPPERVQHQQCQLKPRRPLYRRSAVEFALKRDMHAYKYILEHARMQIYWLMDAR